MVLCQIEIKKTQDISIITYTKVNSKQTIKLSGKIKTRKRFEQHCPAELRWQEVLCCPLLVASGY